MNKSFYNQENIDAYLTNNLSGEEKRAFESGLDKDPLIQNEINLQKEIIESLKQTRKAELKSRLNKIDVGSGLNNSFKFKIAASVLIILGLLSGTYFLINERNTQLVGTTTNKSIISKELNSDKPINIIVPKSAPSVLLEKQLNNSVQKNDVTIVGKQSDVVSLPDTKQTEYSEIKSPDIKENFGDEDIKIESNFTVPEGNVVSNDDTYKSDIELSIQPNGENNFHYQYYSNKLYLYCDFKSKPYELLEWNAKKSKQLYLYFNNTYYELKHNQIEITPLKSINDKKLIKQLESIKDK